MANRVCAKKILDCDAMIAMNSKCLDNVVWLRGGFLDDDETKQAADYLLEAAKLQEKAMEVLLAKLTE